MTMAITLYSFTLAGREPGQLTVGDDGRITGPASSIPVLIAYKMAGLIQRGMAPADAAAALDGWSNGQAFISVDPDLRTGPPQGGQPASRAWAPRERPTGRFTSRERARQFRALPPDGTQVRVHAPGHAAHGVVGRLEKRHPSDNTGTVLVHPAAGGPAAEVPVEAVRPHVKGEVPVTEPLIRGLGWDGEETVRAGWVEAKHPREHSGAHAGEFARKPGTAAAARPAAPAAPARAPGHGPRTAPPPRTGSEPTPAQLADMVGELARKLDDQRDQLRAEQAAELRRVTDEMRREQDRLIRLNSQVEKAAKMSEEHRREMARSVVAVLGLVAVGLLIIATAGLALPPLAAAGIAVGPLLGGEAVMAIHSAAKTRSAHSGPIHSNPANIGHVVT